MRDELFRVNRGGAAYTVKDICGRAELLQNRIMRNSAELTWVEHITAGLGAFRRARACWDKHVLPKTAQQTDVILIIIEAVLF